MTHPTTAETTQDRLAWVKVLKDTKRPSSLSAPNDLDLSMFMGEVPSHTIRTNVENLALMGNHALAALTKNELGETKIEIFHSFKIHGNLNTDGFVTAIKGVGSDAKLVNVNYNSLLRCKQNVENVPPAHDVLKAVVAKTEAQDFLTTDFEEVRSSGKGGGSESIPSVILLNPSAIEYLTTFDQAGIDMDAIEVKHVIAALAAASIDGLRKELGSTGGESDPALIDTAVSTETKFPHAIALRIAAAWLNGTMSKQLQGNSLSTVFSQYHKGDNPEVVKRLEEMRSELAKLKEGDKGRAKKIPSKTKLFGKGEEVALVANNTFLGKVKIVDYLPGMDGDQYTISDEDGKTSVQEASNLLPQGKRPAPTSEDNPPQAKLRMTENKSPPGKKRQTLADFLARAKDMAPDTDADEQGNEAYHQKREAASASISDARGGAAPGLAAGEPRVRFAPGTIGSKWTRGRPATRRSAAGGGTGTRTHTSDVGGKPTEEPVGDDAQHRRKGRSQ